MVEVSTGAPKRKEQNVMVRTGNCEDEVYCTVEQGRNHGFKVGGSERRRPEPRRRGGMGRGEGVSPSPLREGSVEGAVPPSQNFFFIFYLKMVSFGAFWVALPRCMLFRANAQESETEEEGRERVQVKDDILH